MSSGILIGTLTMEMGGKVCINCPKTGYRCDMEFKLKVSQPIIMLKLKKGFLTLCPLEIFPLFFLSSADFFSRSTFSNNSFRNTIRVSNSLNPGQARQNFGPNLSPTVCKSHQ